MPACEESGRRIPVCDACTVHHALTSSNYIGSVLSRRFAGLKQKQRGGETGSTLDVVKHANMFVLVDSLSLMRGICSDLDPIW